MNYKHLYYFWVVAKEGSISRASARLHLTPQTISGQLSQLDSYYGVKLFNKIGRSLELSDVGYQVMSYADDIFSLGNELDEMLKTQTNQRQSVFKVGIVDVIPKSIAHQILLPAVRTESQIKMSCREGELESLLAELAIHRLDLVLAERPIPETVSMTGISKQLGQSSISFFAAQTIIDNLDSPFPECLHDAPLLLPNSKSETFSAMEHWFSQQHIRPRVVAEFDDSALMKAFGQEGVGIFPAPSVLKAEIEQQYQVQQIGKSDQLRQSFYAIYVQKRANTSVVQEIIEASGKSIFS